jgi:hypothetical protein
MPKPIGPHGTLVDQDAAQRATLLAEYRELQMLLSVTDPEALHRYRELKRLLGGPAHANPAPPPQTSQNRAGSSRKEPTQKGWSDSLSPEKPASGPKNSPGDDFGPVPY